jgi:hypothetical protein
MLPRESPELIFSGARRHPEPRPNAEGKRHPGAARIFDRKADGGGPPITYPVSSGGEHSKCARRSPSSLMLIVRLLMS